MPERESAQATKLIDCVLFANKKFKVLGWLADRGVQIRDEVRMGTAVR